MGCSDATARRGVTDYRGGRRGFGLIFGVGFFVFQQCPHGIGCRLAKLVVFGFIAQLGVALAQILTKHFHRLAVELVFLFVVAH